MLSVKWLSPFNHQFNPARNRSFRAVMLRVKEENLKPFSEDDYAYNHVERKVGLLKPPHTVEEQIEYMDSEAFQTVYKDQPVWMMWKRNLWRTSYNRQPPTRLFCIDRNNRFNLNNACPMCRDEYFFFHYKNPRLLHHFLRPGTDRPISPMMTGICQEQLINLRAEVLKAKEHGTMPFHVQFRHYDYSEWYPGLWKQKELFNEAELPNTQVTVEDIYPNPNLKFYPHNRDYNTRWDEWWVRHEKFTRKGR